MSSVLESERALEKKLIEEKPSDGYNVQAVIKANIDKLRKGHYVGRCLTSRLPFPHDFLNQTKPNKFGR